MHLLVYTAAAAAQSRDVFATKPNMHSHGHGCSTVIATTNYHIIIHVHVLQVIIIILLFGKQSFAACTCILIHNSINKAEQRSAAAAGADGRCSVLTAGADGE